LQVKLDGCTVWNAHNIVFGSKRACRRATKIAPHDSQPQHAFW